MSKVTVISFAILKEKLGAHTELELQQGSSVSKFIETLEGKFPEAKDILKASRVAMDYAILQPSEILPDSCTVHLLPPSSGG